MGLGCHVCGSKWHNAASCPIGDNQQRFNKGKNKSKGKGKSWNKGFPRKGYGKSKGFGKKGYPYGGKYGKRSFMQDEMPASFNDYYGGSYLTSTKDKPNMQKDTVRIVAESPEKQEELLDGKKVRFDDKVEYNNGDGAQAGVAKKLNFPAGTTESMDSYHMVRGRRVCGLLVDPGASSGLVGTDTLNELLNSGMVPSGRQDEVIYGPSSTTVTGISGQSDNTLAQVTLPFDLGGDQVPASYTADLIGGQGSTCPALLPNTSLRQLRTVVLTEWFSNGDGVMICSTNGKRADDPQSNLVFMRLLLAESGHYILPVNKQDQQLSQNEMEEVQRLWQKPNTATALEQTWHGDQQDGDEGHQHGQEHRQGHRHGQEHRQGLRHGQEHHHGQELRCGRRARDPGSHGQQL